MMFLLDTCAFLYYLIKNQYFETIQKLPYIHGDPFDRLIISTAFDEHLELLTDDTMIVKYKDISVIW